MMGLGPIIDLWDEYACRAIAWVLKRKANPSAKLQMLIIDLQTRTR